MVRFFLFVSAACLGSIVHAADLSAEDKAKFQSAMISYVESVSVDGAYSYLDTKAREFKTVYPANVHPFVVEVDGNVFVCSEMITEEGETITADFMVAKIDGDYRVVQMLVNDRDALKAAMAKAGG